MSLKNFGEFSLIKKLPVATGHGEPVDHALCVKANVCYVGHQPQPHNHHLDNRVGRSGQKWSNHHETACLSLVQRKSLYKKKLIAPIVGQKVTVFCPEFDERKLCFVQL